MTVPQFIHLWMDIWVISSVNLKKYFFNVYSFLRESERERQSTGPGGTQTEGDTESEAVSGL